MDRVELLTDRPVYYRLHSNPDAPPFNAEHAWSGRWGQAFSADGSQSECGACDSAGCGACDGTGWIDCVPGYSACYTASQLAEYVAEHGYATDDDAVVIFTGRRVDVGFDGEPTVIPDGEVIRWITWRDLLALAREEEE